MHNPDYYKILGLSANAGPTEIKAAYRKLAKIFHPDKNPDNKEALEKFRQIKEAYETLSNPLKKQRYDSKLHYTNIVTSRSRAAKKTKSYSFTEEQAKQRKQYKEQYQKQQSSKWAKPAPKKTSYNETNYILFSIPIAVALLLFIINFYGGKNDPVKSIEKNESPVIENIATDTVSIHKNDTSGADLNPASNPATKTNPLPPQESFKQGVKK